MIYGVRLRDIEVDVEIDSWDDDPDTNAFMIDWHFIIVPPIVVTDADEDLITSQLIQMIADRDDEDFYRA